MSREELFMALNYLQESSLIEGHSAWRIPEIERHNAKVFKSAEQIRELINTALPLEE